MLESEDLKRRAEALVREKYGEDLKQKFGEDADRLMHELAVHQIELELQNEELRRSYHDLEASRARYEALFQHSPVAYVVVDAEGRVTDANSEACRLFKKDKTRLLKISFYTLVAHAHQNLFNRHLNKILEKGGRDALDLNLRIDDAEAFQARIFSMKSDGGSGGDPLCQMAILDVSQEKDFENLLAENVESQTRELAYVNRNLKKEVDVRKQAEAGLRRELNFRKTIEAAIPAGICVAHHDGRIIYVNETFCAMFGYDENELINSFPPYFFWPDEDKDDRLKCFLDKQAETPEVKGDVKKYQKKSGEYFWGLFTLAPLPYGEDEGKAGFLASIVDVTRRKEAEERLTVSEQRLRTLNRKLIDAQETERARISKDLHDSIGASLVAVRFAVERKMKEIRDADCEQEISMAPVLGMLRDIVTDVRRISQNLHPVVLERLGVVTAVKSYCEDFQKWRPDMTFEYAVDLSEDKLSDRMKLLLFRLVQESLANVTKHSKAAHVRFELTEKGGNIVFDMEDDGQGFDVKKTRDAAFNDGEAGLGLQSMKERAESFGGRFSVRSAVGLGARIQAEWPL